MDRVHKAGAKFDYDKATWFNHEPSPSQDDANVWAIHIDESSGEPLGPRQRLTNTTGYTGDMTLSADDKRLSLAKYTLQPDVFISEVRTPDFKLSRPRRLTLDERSDFPYACCKA